MVFLGPDSHPWREDDLGLFAMGIEDEGEPCSDIHKTHSVEREESQCALELWPRIATTVLFGSHKTQQPLERETKGQTNERGACQKHLNQRSRFM